MAQLKKNNPALTWSDECEQAWQEIKQRITNAPIMGFGDFTKPIQLHTDACKNGFAAIITQEKDGKQVLIDAISRTTTPAEKNYSSAKLECACVIWAVKRWKYYLRAAPLTEIVTDSYGLQYLQQKGNESALVQRWIYEMDGYNYKVTYRKGSMNIADFLSRQGDVAAPVTTRNRATRPDYSALNKGIRRQIPNTPRQQQAPVQESEQPREAPAQQLEEQAQQQQQQQQQRQEDAPQQQGQEEPERHEQQAEEPQNEEDEVAAEPQQMVYWPEPEPEEEKPKKKKTGEQTKEAMKPKKNEEQRKEKSTEQEQITREVIIREQMDDTNIQRIWKIATNEHVYQPTEKEKQDAEHLTKVQGMIVKNTMSSTGDTIAKIVVPLSLQRRLVENEHRKNHGGVKSTLADVSRYHWFRGMKTVVKDVIQHCQQCAARKGRPLTKETLAPDERPLELGGRWHVDGLAMPESDGYDHLIVAVDAATKYTIIKPSKGESAEAASDILMEIIRRFGRPREVTTDRGRAFMSNKFMMVCKALHITFKPIAQGQPQADGMVERVNKTLADIASMICEGQGDKWYQFVHEIEYAINTRTSSVTKFTPYELVYGRKPPGPTYTDALCEEHKGSDEGLRKLRRRIEVLQQLAHKNQLKAAKEQKSFHDAHAEAHEFKVGDTVRLYKLSQVERGVTSKLAYKWAGPYTISKVIGPVTFILKDKDGKELPGTAHARNLHHVPAEHTEGESRQTGGAAGVMIP